MRIITHHKAIVAIVDNKTFGHTVDRVIQGLLRRAQLLLDLLAELDIGLKPAALFGQCYLLAGPAADLADQEGGEPCQQYRRQTGNPGDHPDMCPKWCERVDQVQTDRDQQGVIGNAMIAEEARDAIDGARLDERSPSICRDALWDDVFRERLADAAQSFRIFPGEACSDDVVEPDQGEGAA